MCVLCDIKQAYSVAMTAAEAARSGNPRHLMAAALLACQIQTEPTYAKPEDFNRFMRTTGDCLQEHAPDFFRELEAAYVKDGADNGLSERDSQEFMLRVTIGAIYSAAVKYRRVFKADTAKFASRAALWIAPYFAHIPELAFRHALNWKDEKLPPLKTVGMNLEQTDAARKALIMAGAVGDLLRETEHVEKKPDKPHDMN